MAAAAPALAQQSAAPPPNPFRYEDVVRRARDLAAAPYRRGRRPPAGAAQPARFRRLSRHPLPARPGAARHRRRAVPDAALPPRLPVPAPRDGERDPRRRADAGPLPARAVRLRQEPDRAAAAGQPRLRRLPPALSARTTPKVLDEVIAFLGASYFRFLGRGQKYGLSARGLALNVEGAGAGGIPVFPRVLDRDAAGRRRPGVDLRAARRRLGHRRLPVRRLSERARRPSTSPRPCSRGARSPSVGIAPLTSMFFEGENDRRRTGRLPARAARFGRPAHAFRQRASGSGGPCATRPASRCRPSSTPTRAASA